MPLPQTKLFKGKIFQFHFVPFCLVQLHNFVQEDYRNYLAEYVGEMLRLLLLVTGNERERERERKRGKDSESFTMKKELNFFVF
jgi:hypothetical protein